ncbi:MAG TPA: TusE/DsrC/DsvC family sulfur relay protein [Gammaproteobacteria bacterium]|nr:TusE/DsrC/DsvC family sulfur relay protein [Gammaproteobacteria bacterium]
MAVSVNGRTIQTDVEGYLCNPEDWDEDVARAIADRQGIELDEERWALVRFFREYYEDHNGVHPSMHRLLRWREQQDGRPFEDEKIYRDHLYELFPRGPIQTLTRLAGLPAPVEEVEE